MSDNIPLLIATMKAHPNLTLDGLDGRRNPKSAQRRAELLGAYDQFDRAVAWLSQIPKVQKPNRRYGHSYEAKHAAEKWAGGYIANGVLIAAALALGYPVQQCPSGINAWIGIPNRRKWPQRPA